MAQTIVAPLNRLSTRLDLSRTLVFREILTMGVDSLKADKLRSAMTALGMAVGTAALILVVTVALTGKRYVLAQIEGVGTNVIWAEYSGVSSAAASNGIGDYLTAKDMVAVQQEVPGVKEASPVLNMHARIVIGSGKEQDILVLGVDPQYQSVRRIIVSAGRFFDQQDSEAGNKVALLQSPSRASASVHSMWRWARPSGSRKCRSSSSAPSAKVSTRWAAPRSRTAPS